MKTLSCILLLALVGCVQPNQPKTAQTRPAFTFSGTWWAIDTAWKSSGKFKPDTEFLFLSNSNGVLSAQFQDHNTSEVAKWADTAYDVTWRGTGDPPHYIEMYLNCYPDSIVAQVLVGQSALVFYPVQ